jgi:hypothetical protein
LDMMKSFRQRLLGRMWSQCSEMNRRTVRYRTQQFRNGCIFGVKQRKKMGRSARHGSFDERRNAGRRAARLADY